MLIGSVSRTEHLDLFERGISNKLDLADSGRKACDRADGSGWHRAHRRQRGMIPAYDPKLTPMELSPAAHEEASEMAKRLAEKAYAMKKNVVCDFTMASEKEVGGQGPLGADAQGSIH